MSQMNPKKVFHNTAYSVQLPYISCHSLLHILFPFKHPYESIFVKYVSLRFVVSMFINFRVMQSILPHLEGYQVFIVFLRFNSNILDFQSYSQFLLSISQSCICCIYMEFMINFQICFDIDN